jgi:phage-related protein
MTVRLWTSATGRIPVEKFIGRQPPDEAARIMKDINQLEKHGLELLKLSPNKLKCLTGYTNLYELRTNFKGVFYRVIFCVKDRQIWLLEAFKKKSNETPEGHIKVALKRRLSLEII